MKRLYLLVCLVVPFMSYASSASINTGAQGSVKIRIGSELGINLEKANNDIDVAKQLLKSLDPNKTLNASTARATFSLRKGLEEYVAFFKGSDTCSREAYNEITSSVIKGSQSYAECVNENSTQATITTPDGKYPDVYSFIKGCVQKILSINPVTGATECSSDIMSGVRNYLNFKVNQTLVEEIKVGKCGDKVLADVLDALKMTVSNFKECKARVTTVTPSTYLSTLTSTASTVPPTVTSTVPPTVTSTVPPTVTSTVPPTVTSTVPPTVTSTVPPTDTSTVPPTITSTIPPTVTSTVPPTITSTVPPTVTSTVPPTITSTVPPTVTSTVPPTVTSTDPPTVTSTDPPTVTSTVPPTVTSTVPPTITSTDPPTVTSTVPPTVTSTVPPTVTSTDPPTVTSTVPPTVTSTVPSTITSTDPPTVTSTVPPTVTSTVPPTITSTKNISPIEISTSSSPTIPPYFAITQAALVRFEQIFRSRIESLQLIVSKYVADVQSILTQVKATNVTQTGSELTKTERSIRALIRLRVNRFSATEKQKACAVVAYDELDAVIAKANNHAQFCISNTTNQITSLLTDVADIEANVNAQISINGTAAIRQCANTLNQLGDQAVRTCMESVISNFNTYLNEKASLDSNISENKFAEAQNHAGDITQCVNNESANYAQITSGIYSTFRSCAGFL